MLRSGRPCVRIVENEQPIRRLIALLIDGCGFESRGYESAESFISDDPLSQPGCVLVDLELGGMSGIELVGWIRQQPNPLPTIVVTGDGSARSAVQCLKSGAIDFLEKPIDAPRLTELVCRAVELDANQRLSRQRLVELQERYSTLSPRQKQVMVLLAEGLSTKQIAARLGVASKTAEHQRGAVMKRMHAESLADLVKAVVELGL